MRTTTAVVVAVALVGCGDDFEAGGLVFNSTLSREGLKWSPEQRIATGSEFSLAFSPKCVFDCPEATAPQLTVRGSGVAVSQHVITTVASGAVVFEASRSGRTGSFATSVVDADELLWEDPLVGAAIQYRPIDQDGGVHAPPRVGDEIVVHAGGNVILELWAASRGSWLGTGSNLVVASGPSLVQTGHNVDVAGVTQTVTLSLNDGGLPTTRTVRAGDVSEVVGLELLFMPVPWTSYVVHAVPRRGDGGVYYGAPVAWAHDEGSEPSDYTNQEPRLPQRGDVAVFAVRCEGDGGSLVTASVGAVSTSVTLPCKEASPPAPERAPAPKQGCAAVPGSWLGLALVAWLGRRRRSV